MDASTTTPTAQDVANALCDILSDGHLAEFDDAFEGARARSFEWHGVLTTDAGAVLKLSNGAEFQITVVQSRRATEAQ